MILFRPMYKIKLDKFEGPFDLLVYLIEHSRMDIYDISISTITEQYLHEINRMKELNIDVASDFIFLASRLMQIKSKLLLPQTKSIDNQSDYEESRDELIDNIIEYKKFKAVASHLAKLEEKALKLHAKPQSDLTHYLENKAEISISTTDFIKAFRLFLDKSQQAREIKKRYEYVPIERATDTEKRRQIEDFFKSFEGGEISFSNSCLDSGDSYDISLSFVSMLELIKQNKLTARQKFLFDEIFLNKGAKLDSPN